MLCDAFDKISKPKLAIQVFENVLFLWIMNDAQVNIGFNWAVIGDVLSGDAPDVRNLAFEIGKKYLKPSYFDIE